MSTDQSPHVSERSPQETWDILEQEPEAVLFDVRTDPEWGFVGLPDLSKLGNKMHCIEWAQYPGMSFNPRFLAEVKEALDGATPSKLFFLCRSGVRSLRAAEVVSEALNGDGHVCDCINVAEGFEGDLDASKRRGGLTGWKARGLPWRQS